MSSAAERVDDLKRHSSISANSNYYDFHGLAVEKLQDSTTVLTILSVLTVTYYFLGYVGLVPLSIPQTLWNLIVYLTPTRILIALDTKFDDQQNSESLLVSPMTFQAKSDALQRLLGIDSSSFFSVFRRGRSVSGIGNVLLGPRDNVPPGLGNWDNSCYQNSTIQGLASLRSLAEFLNGNLETLSEKGSFATHSALKGIIDALNRGSSYSRKMWIPPDLKSMSSWQQQDAQEYFSKIVDQVDREVSQALRGQTTNVGLKKAGSQKQVHGDLPSPGELHDSAPFRYAVRRPPLRNPLEGLLAQRVGCMRCGWTEGLSLIPFTCLTVPLGANWSYDVRDCLDQYMTLEAIEGVECVKCTLLRARDQLQQLLKQVESDQPATDTPDSARLPEALKKSAESRLETVEAALQEEDFAEPTLSKKCRIPAKSRVTSTKSKQAVIARAPKCFVIHINRSMFDENTGMLRKNHADVRFPSSLDLGEWCLGKKYSRNEGFVEKWDTNPQHSMLPDAREALQHGRKIYELRAVITHYGRHENGHYICYRKYPTATFPAHVPEAVFEADGGKEKAERWYRLSDDDVQMVSERNVMSQGGVFMLFYEEVEDPVLLQSHLDEQALTTSKESDVLNRSETSEDMSTSAGTDGLTQDGSGSESSRSRSTSSISPPDRLVPPIEQFDPSTASLKAGHLTEEDGFTGDSPPSISMTTLT